MMGHLKGTKDLPDGHEIDCCPSTTSASTSASLGAFAIHDQMVHSKPENRNASKLLINAPVMRLDSAKEHCHG